MKLPLVTAITLFSLLAAPAAMAQDATPALRSGDTKQGRTFTQERRATYERIRDRIRRALSRPLNPESASQRQTKPGKPLGRGPARPRGKRPGDALGAFRSVRGKKPVKPLGKKPGKTPRTKPSKKPVKKPVKPLGKKPGRTPRTKPGKPLGKRPAKAPRTKPGKPLRRTVRKPGKKPNAQARRTSQDATQRTAPERTRNPHPPSGTRRARGNSRGLSGMLRGMGGEQRQGQGSRRAGNPH